MKMVVVYSLIWVSLGLFLGTRPAVSEDQPEENGSKLAELRKERHDTLSTLVDVVETHYTSGSVNFEKLIVAKNLLLDAKLSMLEKGDKQGRLEILRSRVKNMEKLELTAEEHYKVGKETAQAMLIAKAARLQSEIELHEAMGSDNDLHHDEEDDDA